MDERPCVGCEIEFRIFPEEDPKYCGPCWMDMLDHNMEDYFDDLQFFDEEDFDLRGVKIDEDYSY